MNDDTLREKIEGLRNRIKRAHVYPEPDGVSKFWLSHPDAVVETLDAMLALLAEQGTTTRERDLCQWIENAFHEGYDAGWRENDGREEAPERDMEIAWRNSQIRQLRDRHGATGTAQTIAATLEEKPLSDEGADAERLMDAIGEVWCDYGVHGLDFDAGEQPGPPKASGYLDHIRKLLAGSPQPAEPRGHYFPPSDPEPRRCIRCGAAPFDEQSCEGGDTLTPEPPRYTRSPNDNMVPSKHGEWVRWEDIAHRLG